MILNYQYSSSGDGKVQDSSIGIVIQVLVFAEGPSIVSFDDKLKKFNAGGGWGGG